MGRFGRRPQRMDEVLPFLTVDDAAYLRRLAAGVFARAGVEVVIHADRLDAADGVGYGLWNLADLSAVAVPDRHTLTLHVPVDAGVIGAVQAMARGTANIWASAPGGVSPSVYWWRDGVLTTVSRVTEDGRVAVEVHPELGEVLNRLAAL